MTGGIRANVYRQSMDPRGPQPTLYAMDNRCIEGLERVPPDARACVLTLGNFDGVHLGHRRIVESARDLADREGVAVAAMTFEPPPAVVLRPDDEHNRISGPDEKARLLLEAGADWVVLAETTTELLALSAEQFVGRVIVDRFAPVHMVEGHNFFFGHRRSGDVTVLRELGRQGGFDVRLVDPVSVSLACDQPRVSSTLIRELLQAGRVDDANTALGRPFALAGRVVPGERRGTALTFPTINLGGFDQVIPAKGVYAGLADVAGTQYAAAISVGTKPTFGRAPLAVEAFLLNADGDFYDEKVTVTFLRRLRDQIRFPDAESLKAQMAKDVQRVQEICE